MNDCKGEYTEKYVLMLICILVGHLQKYYPAALLQSDMVDVSLGKWRPGDGLKSFAHLLSEDAATAAGSSAAAVSFSMNESAATLDFHMGDGTTTGDEDN